MSNWNGNRFSVYTSEEKSTLKLVEELGKQTNFNTDELENKTDKNGDHPGTWQGLSKPTLSEEGMRATVEKLDKDIKAREYIEVNLNQYDYIAKKGTPQEDWSLAFKHVFDNVIKDNSGVVKWSGQLLVKSTINVPYGVALHGSSLPYSGLIVDAQFNGEYVITQVSKESHIDFRNIYIAFERNPNVRGIYIAQPYDYSTLDTLVASQPNRTFLYIGNELVGQTLRMQNCCVYAKNTIYEPLVYIENMQEGYFCNNKFLSSGYCNVDMVVCEGVNTSTWINNSFANTNKIGLVYKYEKYKKRPLGNLFTGNLFENIKGEYALSIVGDSHIDNEGYNNSIMNNDYMNATQEVLLEYIANSIVIDRCTVQNGRGARRTFNINPYDASVATNPYGHCMLKADGELLIGKFKGTFNGEMDGNVRSRSIKIPTLFESTKADAEIMWNASDSVDYGLQIKKGQTIVLNMCYGDVENPTNGGGYRLKSPNGTQYGLYVNDNGVLETRRL